MNYNMGQVIWDSKYQKYLIIIGYNKETDKYIVDNHKIIEMNAKDIDEFKNNNYNETNFLENIENRN